MRRTNANAVLGEVKIALFRGNPQPESMNHRLRLNDMKIHKHETKNASPCLAESHRSLTCHFEVSASLFRQCHPVPTPTLDERGCAARSIDSWRGAMTGWLDCEDESEWVVVVRWVLQAKQRKGA